jgi:hypothetical protein
MDSGPLFNKIWVIESLRPNDRKTGTILYEDVLLHQEQSNPDLSIELVAPATKDEFLESLQKIEEQASLGQFPMVHLECHGCKEGLQMSNLELVSWKDLRDSLIRINIACRLNLVLVVGACNGIHLIKVSTKLDRAPFWAVIGPERKINEGEIERDFGAFYRKFFESLNGDAAMDALNSGVAGPDRTYHFRTSVGLFMRAYIAYHTKYRMGKGKRSRIEKLVTEAMKERSTAQKGVNWVRRNIKHTLAKEEQHFHKFKNRFFLIDKYPENAQRFSITYVDVLASLPS